MPVFAVLAAIEEIISSAILSSVTASSEILAVVIAASEILPDVIPADIVPEDIVIPLPAVRASCFAYSFVFIGDVTSSKLLWSAASAAIAVPPRFNPPA